MLIWGLSNKSIIPSLAGLVNLAPQYLRRDLTYFALFGSQHQADVFFVGDPAVFVVDFCFLTIHNIFVVSVIDVGEFACPVFFPLWNFPHFRYIWGLYGLECWKLLHEWSFNANSFEGNRLILRVMRRIIIFLLSISLIGLLKVVLSVILCDRLWFVRLVFFITWLALIMLLISTLYFSDWLFVWPFWHLFFCFSYVVFCTNVGLDIFSLEVC